MKRIFYYHNMSAFITLICFILLIAFIRWMAYNTISVEHHHERFIVESVEQCYNGKYRICSATIKDKNGELVEMELDYIVQEGQTLYKYCWYKGIEKHSRWCNIGLKHKLNREFQTYYGDL